MSGTFPLTPAPSALKIQSYQPTRVSLSHNLRRSVRTNGAQRWVITADWVGLTRAQFAPIQAFVLAQRGQWDTFTAALPAHKLPQGVAYLSPTLVEAILDGKYPAHLTMKDLMEPFPMEWERQREHFFSRSSSVQDG